MTYDMSRLNKLGTERRRALATLARIRKEVAEELPQARAAKVTWRQLSESTSYTDAQLQTMILPEDEQERREQHRRERRRKPKGAED